MQRKTVVQSLRPCVAAAGVALSWRCMRSTRPLDRGADNSDVFDPQYRDDLVPQTGLELASTVGFKAERRTEAWHPGVDEGSGDSVFDRDSFRPACESANAGEEVLIGVGMWKWPNDVDVDVLDSR